MEEPKSQIYHSGYERWEGDRNTHTPAWLLIGIAGFKNVVKSSGCLGRSLFIIYLVGYYLFIGFGTFVRMQADNLKHVRDLGLADMFRDNFPGWTEAYIHKFFVVRPGIGFAIFAMIFYGAQLITKDRSANALQVYFSKAVSRLDYVLGKYLAVGFIVALGSLIPSGLMLVLGLVFATDYSRFLIEAWYIPLVAGLFWLFLTFSIGTIALYFSSLFQKTYMAAVSFLGFLVFSSIIASILKLLLGFKGFVGGLDWISSIHGVGSFIFTLSTESSVILAWQFFDLLLLCSVMLFLMSRNIRPVEVVK